jgi:hypothetical protein
MSKKTKALAKRGSDVDLSAVENILIKGDLSGLNEGQRVKYLRTICESVGINPLTRPFEYIMLNGKLTLYARKDATDQLRRIHNVSIKIKDRKKEGDMYTVCAEAITGSGRTDSAIGVISLGAMKGVDLANAMMKAETKAKRRVTLSICGLGFLDETEIEDVPAREVSQSAADELQKKIEAQPEPTPEFTTTSYQFDPPDEEEADELADYVIKAGKNEGKKLKDIPTKQLRQFITWADSQENLHPDVEEYRAKAVEFLIRIDGAES